MRSLLRNNITPYLKKKVWEFMDTTIYKVGLNSFNQYINPVTKRQRIDYKGIPIIIVNYNQLYNLQLLINALHRRGYYNIHIIDNNSTYPPLLEFYKITNVNVIRLDDNLGPQALWRYKNLYRKFKNGYYVVTDPDVVPVEDCPDDFLLHFLNVLEKYPNVVKVGFALKIDDIPDFYPLKEKVLNWERKFWQHPVAENVYQADIDTTFALYRPFSNIASGFLTALRVGGNYMASHGGWYIDPKHPTEEQAYYMKTASNASTWILNSDSTIRKSSEIYFK